MNCQEVRNFIESNPEVSETFKFSSEVNGHLQECLSCQAYYRDQLKFLELVQSSFDRLNPSAEFEERLSSASNQSRLGGISHQLKHRLLVTDDRSPVTSLALAAGVLIIIIFGFFVFNQMEKPSEPAPSVPEITGVGAPAVFREQSSEVAVSPRPFASELIVFNFDSGIQSDLIIIQGGGFYSEEVIIE